MNGRERISFRDRRMTEVDVWFLVDVLFLFAGCYLISIGVKAKLSGDLKDLKQVMPKYAHPGRCQDARGFLQAVLPWLFLFWTGFFLSKLRPEGEGRELRLPLAAALGKRSLLVYLLHQPVIYGILLAGQFLIPNS